MYYDYYFYLFIFLSLCLEIHEVVCQLLNGIFKTHKVDLLLEGSMLWSEHHRQCY